MILNKGLNNQILPILQTNNISFGEYLKNHTYTKMGGKADYFLTPSSYDEVRDMIQFFRNENIPITIIGNGSKLIVRDGGVRGAVISLKKMNKIFVEGDRIIAQGGASIIDVTKKALEEKLSGIEFACGIPGSVGGTVYMNAGAYDGEIKDVLESVYVVDKDNNIVRRDAVDLEFGYRYSNIGDRGDLVIEATFHLQKADYEQIKVKIDEFTEQRKLKQPLEYPSCGSVFKRPEGYYAGKLIQDCNLQGKRIGGAEVSKKHAGFIVNVNNATANDYISLIELIQKTVKEKYNVSLEKEVIIIGED